MPRKESSATFNAAARHFFRCLHDPRALRNNPLVAHLFKGDTITGLAQARDERGAARRIHQLVREAAGYCRDSDLAAGKGARALRQHAIVMLQCLEQRPVREVATALGISYYHCYRERASICLRIARYVSERSRSELDYLGELDEFGLQLNYTRYRATFADAEATRQATEELARAAPSAHRMIEAMRIGAMLTMDFGSLSWADEAYGAARGLFSERLVGAPQAERVLAQGSLDLFGSELAHRRGESQQAFVLADRANARLEASLTGAPPYVRAMYTESLFALGATSWSLGNTEMCYRCFSRAEASLRHLDAASLPLHARVMANLWRLRNYLLLSGECWYPAWKRREGLLTAFHQAYASGSLGNAVDALVVLTEHHAFSGSDDEALRAGRLAVRLANGSTSELLRHQTLIEVCTGLLPTRHRDFASSLLTNAWRDDLDAYHRELLAYLEGERLLRLGLFEDALALTTGESNRWQFATLTVRGQIVAAAAAHALERRTEACALIEAAVAAAEELSSAPALRDAYRVAGRVTGESRFKRQANEVSGALTT